MIVPLNSARQEVFFFSKFSIGVRIFIIIFVETFLYMLLDQIKKSKLSRDTVVLTEPNNDAIWFSFLLGVVVGDSD